MIYIDTNLDELTAEYDSNGLDVSWVGMLLNIKINSYDGKWHKIDIYNEDKSVSTCFYVKGI